jgi:hypothetical protein
MQNFELVSELQALLRRDFPVANPALINPTNANPLMDGEFLSLDSSYKLIRAADGSLGFALFMEKGRFDVQAMSGKKTMVLFGGTYEADTRVFTAASLTLLGQLQISASVTVDTLTKSGLANYSSGEVVGYVTRLPANNGGRLRFLQTLV